jgi:hypothetical protein
VTSVFVVLEDKVRPKDVLFFSDLFCITRCYYWCTILSPQSTSNILSILNIVYGILHTENVIVCVVLSYLVMEWIICMGPKLVLLWRGGWVVSIMLRLHCVFTPGERTPSTLGGHQIGSGLRLSSLWSNTVLIELPWLPGKRYCYQAIWIKCNGFCVTCVVPFAAPIKVLLG